MTSINSVSVLNPKLNHHHHNPRLSVPHSPTFHPLLKHDHTFKLSLPLNQRKPLTVTFVAPQHDDDSVNKGNDVDLGEERAREFAEAIIAYFKDEDLIIPEFHDLVGILYGLIQSVGGFLSFMITGSNAGIRFGVILGGALLALSNESVQSYKKRHPSSLPLKGQTAITSILFLREIRSVGRGSTYFSVLISGMVAAFYVSRLVLEGKTQKG